jgi:hypothetical protein
MIKNITLKKTLESLCGIDIAVAQAKQAVYFSLLLVGFVTFLTFHLFR